MMRLVNVIGVTLLLACDQSKPPAPSRPVEASALPAIKVTSKAKMLFTYAEADGSFQTADKLDKVPVDRRGWVRVVDVKLKPDQRRDHELVYVADLRQEGKGGSYPYVVMSRRAFESAAVTRAHQGASEPAAARGAEIILYAASWCPACRSARQYLRENKIPFVEKDIEKDSAAAAELLQKAKAAGISASGVPVLDVKGKLMQGFDPKQLHELLGDKK
jgi:glutaredoxin